MTEPEECLRCGYDLRGIGNDQACPECGLLAERSRRVSDELHDTRPKWLKRLARGVDLLLLAIVVPLPWALLLEYFWQVVVYQWGWWPAARSAFLDSIVTFSGAIGPLLSAALILFGVLLLTTREGYPPADRADARLRRMARLAATGPLIMVILASAQTMIDLRARAERTNWTVLEIALIVVTIATCPALPLLIFLVLRGLAKRARSAHVAEHCLIVGIGASAALVYIGLAWIVLFNGDAWFGQHWVARSKTSFVLMLVLALLAILFLLWSVYLLIRFEIAFHNARRELKRKWKIDDRSRTEAALSA